MPRTHELSPVTQSQISRLQRDNYFDAMNRVTSDQSLLQKQIQLEEFLRDQCMDETDYQDYLQILGQMANNLIMPDIPKKPTNHRKQRPMKHMFGNFIIETDYEYSNKTKRNREKKSYNMFLEKIVPYQEYTSEEITNIYNLTFETNITRAGFGMLNETKNYFNVIRRKKRGKNTTIYTLR